LSLNIIKLAIIEDTLVQWSSHLNLTQVSVIHYSSINSSKKDKVENTHGCFNEIPN